MRHAHRALGPRRRALVRPRRPAFLLAALALVVGALSLGFRLDTPAGAAAQIRRPAPPVGARSPQAAAAPAEVGCRETPGAARESVVASAPGVPPSCPAEPGPEGAAAESPPAFAGVTPQDVTAALADLVHCARGPDYEEAEARAGRVLAAGFAGDPRAAVRAWELLRDSGAPVALQRTLVRALVEGGTLEDRAGIVRLGGSPGGAPELRVFALDLLASPVADVRLDPARSSAIAPALGDPVAEVRAAACRLLAAWAPTDAEARSHVEAAAASPDATLRAIARGALGW